MSFIPPLAVCVFRVTVSFIPPLAVCVFRVSVSFIPPLAVCLFSESLCPALDTSMLSVTSLSRTQGASVNVSCSAFGHRVVGARSLLCNASSLWQPAVPSCECQSILIGFVCVYVCVCVCVCVATMLQFYNFSTESKM